ncbi:uncharacterized protein LOC114844906 [Betta splendens]|uniref:Uncharacterized protein LOC114844906 n=1 Tax=Betta splendens TaxID=158456 RepID=A0A6P7L1C8_BETSP|nr:uncharacterized protein LOC114844906 [Betta splendens]
MTGDGNRPRGLVRSAAVMLLLFSLAPSLNCFSVRGLGKNAHQDTTDGAAAVTRGRIGHIIFGNANIPPWSSFEGNGGSAHVDLPQADGTGALGQSWQQLSPQEAAWRRLNPSLSCGATRMKLRAMGPGAANLQLDMGQVNGVARSLPLIHVPRSCGYTMRQNALGLVLLVPYDGCGVTQQNGNYVLPMSWQQNPVKLACPTLQNDPTVPQTTAATTTTTTSPPTTVPPTYPFQNFPYDPLYSQFQWAQQWPPADATTSQPTTTPTTVPPAMNPAVNPNYPPYFYPPPNWPQQSLYVVPPANPAPTTPPTTPAQPATMPPPAVNPNYPPFPYLPYYSPLSWPQPMLAPATTPDAATTPPTTSTEPTSTTESTTNAPPTVNPPMDEYLYYQYPYFWFGPPSSLDAAGGAAPAGGAAAGGPVAAPADAAVVTAPAETTTMPPTTTPPSTEMPTQPSLPADYPNYQYYPSGFPGQPGLYYPLNYPQYPQSPTDCAMQSDTSASCPNKMPGSSSYFDLSAYYPYSWNPFLHYPWHRNKHFPSSWRYRIPAGYLPGVQSLVQPYPGFLYPQPMPWFSYPGQQMSQGV